MPSSIPDIKLISFKVSFANRKYSGLQIFIQKGRSQTSEIDGPHNIFGETQSNVKGMRSKEVHLGFIKCALNNCLGKSIYNLPIFILCEGSEGL